MGELEYGACLVMGQVVAPKSLRSVAAFDEKFTSVSGKKVSAVAGLIAAASVSSGAEAQQSNLPPVTVDAPVARPRPVTSKPSPEQVRANAAAAHWQLAPDDLQQLDRIL